MEHKGYHFRKKKAKLRDLLYLSLHRRLFSSLLAACSLLLASSVRVASLAMQPRLVELWQYQALHLRRVHSDQKHKQRGTFRPVYSNEFHYYSLVLVLWLVVVSSTVLLASNLDAVMGTIRKLHMYVLNKWVGTITKVYDLESEHIIDKHLILYGRRQPKTGSNIVHESSKTRHVW